MISPNDFPDGLSRSTTYVGVITLDIKALAEATNEYPLVPGDTITCDYPAILRPNSTMTGRLRDASADWDSQHNGVGNYTIKDGKLTLSYDEGYIVEKSGKILTSSINFLEALILQRKAKIPLISTLPLAVLLLVPDSLS